MFYVKCSYKNATMPIVQYVIKKFLCYVQNMFINKHNKQLSNSLFKYTTVHMLKLIS